MTLLTCASNDSGRLASSDRKAMLSNMIHHPCFPTLLLKFIKYRKILLGNDYDDEKNENDVDYTQSHCDTSSSTDNMELDKCIIHAIRALDLITNQIHHVCKLYLYLKIIIH